MRAIVRDADPNLFQGTVMSMDQVVLSTLGDRLFQTRVLGIFAALAVLLAAVGVYGVTAYSVSERTREIGIRIALGARSGQLAKLTLVKVIGLVMAGLFIGTAGGRAAAALLEASLYGVSPSDPLTYAGVALLLTGVAVVAALAPIRRATRVSPLEALKD